MSQPSVIKSWRTPRRAWRAAGHEVLVLAFAARRTWRRSLQLRVIAITLLASGLLVGAFGYLVAARSVAILLNGATVQTEKQVKAGAEYAKGQLSVSSQPDDPLIATTLQTTVVYLAGNTEQAGGLIVLFKPADPGKFRPVTSAPGSPDRLAAEVVSPELERRVAGRWELASQIRTLDLDGHGPVKYLVYGSPVPTRFGEVELYYLVPLTTQDRIAGQIRATVLLTGTALVFLLAVVASLVTRMVVKPVRVAARTAQRLSAGLLDQRMIVSGEDDLALLAASFNQMAQNLQRQIVRLEEMSRLQRRFTSDVSHELRTPLTTVRMAADLIFAERDGFDPVVARSAELLQAELDRFESLLTDLLEISRFDAGFAMLDAEPTDLVQVVERVVERIRSLADRAHVPIRVDVPDAPVIAEVDPRRVERVLRNLVGNAVEHAEAEPVDVTLRADASAVAVTVRDRGVGLQPGEDKLVFNRFWRADPSRARQTGGTGLGLSISLEDARLHGGWLEAWGVPGEGAQFRLTVPVRAGDRLLSSPLRLVPPDAPAEPPVGGGADPVMWVEPAPAGEGT